MVTETIVKEFAEKYNFIQEKDITKIETSEFCKQDYLKIDQKPFITINKYTDKTEIAFGKIQIEIDTIDEEEWYYIDKNNYCVINVSDYTTEDSLIEAIITECKNLQITLIKEKRRI